MPMRPSKKVFIGTSLVLTAVLLQVILGLVASRLMGSVAAGIESAGTMENVDGVLDGIHRQSITLFVGYGLTWVLTLSGIVLFVIGVYQNCRATEILLASTRSE